MELGLNPSRGTGYPDQGLPSSLQAVPHVIVYLKPHVLDIERSLLILDGQRSTDETRDSASNSSSNMLKTHECDRQQR